MLEVIPGKLVWAPEVADKDAEQQGKIVEVRSLCGSALVETAEEAKRAGVYNVHHYTAEALGHAFGPLGFDQMCWFVRNLTSMLEVAKRPLVLTTPIGDQTLGMNSSVLLGAYLIFRLDWSAERVGDLLPAVGRGLFACSWARKDRAEPTRRLSVSDCWAGCDLARRLKWVDASVFDSDVATDMYCSKWRHMTVSYDCSWIVPGMVMVGADPMTTALDPNPETFTEMWPREGVSSDYDPTSPKSPFVGDAAFSASLESGEDCQSPQAGGARQRDHVDASHINMPSAAPNLNDALLCNGARPQPEEEPLKITIQTINLGLDAAQDQEASPRVSDAAGPARSREAEADMQSPARVHSGLLGRRDLDVRSEHSFGNLSVDTVSKEYRFTGSASSPGKSKREKPSDFVSFLQQSSIKVVVRCNYDNEPGMPPTGSYKASDMQAYGVQLLDVPIVDLNGGLPTPHDVQRLLLACTEPAGDGAGQRELPHAVLVHCKGGFGRSVILACCLVVERCDIPGRALLGWVRIARPGAINTPQQEGFLQQMSCRADVRRFAGLRPDGTRPKCECALQ